MTEHTKIAVTGATGRVGRHVVDVLETQGHEVAAIARRRGVDVITGEGLDEALAGASCIVDAATGASPDQQEATTFFETAARNLQEAGLRAGVDRMVLVSIIGTELFATGYNAAKYAHERAALDGPLAVRILRAAQFHEFVAQLLAWGTQGEGRPRAGDAHAARSGADGRRGARAPGDRSRPRAHAGLRRRADLGGRRPARGGASGDGDLAGRAPGRRVRVEAVSDPSDPDHELYTGGALLPSPGATLAGPTFEEWLGSAADATG